MRIQPSFGCVYIVFREKINTLFIFISLFSFEHWIIGLDKQKIRYKIVILTFYIWIILLLSRIWIPYIYVLS